MLSQKNVSQLSKAFTVIDIIELKIEQISFRPQQSSGSAAAVSCSSVQLSSFPYLKVAAVVAAAQLNCMLENDVPLSNDVPL